MKDGSDLSALLYGIKTLIKDGFMTCNSTGDGKYSVEVRVDTLIRAQALHRLLVKLTDT